MDSQNRSYDVAIIGAGIVGAMTARTLSKYELSCIVLESGHDVASGATRANSAIVHAGFDALPGTKKASLGLKGSQMMEEITRQLGVPYKRNGSLVIAEEDERGVIEVLLDRGKQNGVPDLRIVEAEELHRMEPRLSERAVCALYAPTGAITCPYELCIAAMGNAMDNGVELLCDFTVTAAERQEDGSFLLTSSDGAAVRARRVVNAAGIMADRVASLFGDHSFTITPRRGEYDVFDKECGTLFQHTLFRAPSPMGKGILISPTVDGNLILGPNAHDVESRTDTATTSDGLREIAEASRRFTDAIPMNAVITSFSGLRAVGSTGDFILNCPTPGFVNAAGIESPGLSASPAIALALVDLLAEDGMTLREKENWNPIRRPFDWFRRMSDEEKNEVIAKDPAYGRIVCRCEGISEGEIRDAIRMNPRAGSLDAVKLRVRAGTGRCQGGFCSPSVMKLLADEWKIPLASVTKKGGQSYIGLHIMKGGR